jgi:ribosomal protein L11 methyltransferase
MPYLKLSITTTPEQAEALSESLSELGALSVSFQDAKDEPIFQIEPGTSPLWQHTKVDALFAENTPIDTIISALKSENTDFTQLDFSVEKIEDQDWVRITQQHFQPKKYGNHLWVCPAWHETEALDGTVVKIDPGLAFGTGTHPTTALCLTWLADHPPMDKTVIDYGCGSGILSLAALALGANTVIAIDHDPQALIATENNAKLNKDCQKQRLMIMAPEQALAAKAELILANILAVPLIELAPLIISALNHHGTLILSGILEREIPAVTNAYEAQLTLIDTAVQDEWARLVFHKP